MDNSLAKITSVPKQDNPNVRGVTAFPEIDEFYNTLMDRLDMVLGHILEDEYTIFINTIPRNHTPGEKQEMDRFNIKTKLIYAGLVKQKQLIDLKLDTKIKQKYWDELKLANLTPETSKVSLELFKKLRQGSYDLHDIEAGSLKEYFLPILEPKKKHPSLSNLQIAEYHILNGFLEGEIESYNYLSVPLIQFAEFDGVVHIILSKKDYEDEFIYKKRNNNGEIIDRILNTKAIGRVIVAFSREYEGIILDWDIVGGLRLKETSYSDAAYNENLYKFNNQDNPILNKLKYRKYYIRHKQYFLDRFKYSNQVPTDLRNQYRKIAILHILLDSYAHNISAHSLTALEWWFKIRADRQNLKSITQSNIALLKERNVSLDRDIHPLLRFFLDKGAFWTGLTRDYSFGGQIKHLHGILWEEFINNPLYLGTIAFTEGIVKINIHITFLSIISHEKNVKIKKKVEFDELYAQVDLTEFSKPENYNKDIQQITNFVKPGPNFTVIRNKLRKCKVFFPAGVVGVHSFFTILENELRNVKHYKQEQLNQIQKEGLTLNLSIEETSYDVISPIPEKEKHYYKIGVWLRHPTQLTKELILLRPKRLYADIMENADKEFRPKLGGTYQDKVCSGMLFTNSFNKIEDKKSERGKQFYPWVKAGYCTQLEYKKGEEIDDWELSARRALAKATIDTEDPLFEIKQKLSEDKDLRASRALFDKEFKEEAGYFKKFFHLWKGEDIYEIENPETLDEKRENVSRFRFVYLSEDKKAGFRKVREAGIIRIIHQKVNKEDIKKAYHLWLLKWLDKTEEDLDYKVDFTEKKQAYAQLGINKSEIFFNNSSNLEFRITKQLQIINLVHNEAQNDEFGGPAIRFRNHGIFRKYFYKKNNKSNLFEVYPERQGELLELLGTRICAFDNRIAKRFEELDKTVLKNQLFFEAHQEKSQLWEQEKQNGFFKHHFLIVHLSFIEALSNKAEGKDYNEDDIKTFLDKEILQGKTPPNNFIVVIVTGRGRTLWWNNLKDSSVQSKHIPYTSFVTFRSIESMTTAIENALGMPDDIELKYRMVKILFGS